MRRQDRCETGEDVVEGLAAAICEDGAIPSACHGDSTAIIVDAPCADLIAAVRNLPGGAEIADIVANGEGGLMIAALPREAGSGQPLSALPEGYWRFLIQD